MVPVKVLPNSRGSHKSAYLLCSLNLLLRVADMGETDKLQREVDRTKLKPYNCVCVSVDGGSPPPTAPHSLLTEVGVRTYRNVWKRSWGSRFAQKLEEKQQASVRSPPPGWWVGVGVFQWREAFGIFFFPPRRKRRPGGWSAFIQLHNNT